MIRWKFARCMISYDVRSWSTPGQHCSRSLVEPSAFSSASPSSPLFRILLKFSTGSYYFLLIEINTRNNYNRSKQYVSIKISMILSLWFQVKVRTNKRAISGVRKCGQHDSSVDWTFAVFCICSAVLLQYFAKRSQHFLNKPLNILSRYPNKWAISGLRKCGQHDYSVD